jgi:chromosome segregation ATPase
VIEQGIYFGLGCVVAGLLALLFMPVLWARALRLTRQRLQAQIPVSMQEILADRDHLRAEFAVERRKLEQMMERVSDGKAADMAELGRRAVLTDTLTDRVAALEAIEKRQSQTILELEGDARAHDGQRGALQVALHDAHAGLEDHLRRFDALRGDHEALEDLAEERRTTVAGLHTRTMGLEMTIEDLERVRAALDRQLKASKQDAQLLLEERDHLLSQTAAMQDAHDNLRKRLAGEAAQATTLAQVNLTLRGDLEKAQIRTRLLEAEIEAAVHEAKEREKTIYLQNSLQAERARGDGRAGLDKLQALQAENAGLRGALEAARRLAGNATAVLVSERGEDDAALRVSIHELGLAVVKMTDNAHAADHQRAKDVSPEPADSPST